MAISRRIVSAAAGFPGSPITGVSSTLPIIAGLPGFHGNSVGQHLPEPGNGTCREVPHPCRRSCRDQDEIVLPGTGLDRSPGSGRVHPGQSDGGPGLPRLRQATRMPRQHCSRSPALAPGACEGNGLVASGNEADPDCIDSDLRDAAGRERTDVVRSDSVACREESCSCLNLFSVSPDVLPRAGVLLNNPSSRYPVLPEVLDHDHHMVPQEKRRCRC